MPERNDAERVLLEGLPHHREHSLEVSGPAAAWGPCPRPGWTRCCGLGHGEQASETNNPQV